MKFRDSNYKILRIVGGFLTFLYTLLLFVVVVALANKTMDEGKLSFDWVPENLYVLFFGIGLGLICTAIADIADKQNENT